MVSHGLYSSAALRWENDDWLLQSIVSVKQSCNSKIETQLEYLVPGSQKSKIRATAMETKKKQPGVYAKKRP